MDKAIWERILPIFITHQRQSYQWYFDIWYPLKVLISMLDTELTSFAWPQLVTNCLQLALGLLITACLLIKGRVSYVGAWIIFMPLGMVLFGSLSSIPLWLAALVGLTIFKGVLIAGGLVTSSCAYVFGAKVVLEKVFELKFHHVADKAAQNVARHISS